MLISPKEIFKSALTFAIADALLSEAMLKRQTKRARSNMPVRARRARRASKPLKVWRDCGAMNNAREGFGIMDGMIWR